MGMGGHNQHLAKDTQPKGKDEVRPKSAEELEAERKVLKSLSPIPDWLK
jgi:hypothetical protein